MTSDFVHLHVHTEYSLLDGHSRIKTLVQRAKELEMPALAITDHGVMFGVIDFFRACKDAGVKPVIGMEAYLAPRGMEDRDSVLDKKPYHMLLLAKNMTGYQNLLHLASEAQLRGYYYRPRIDRELMAAYAEGLVATSGCLAAEIPRMVENGQEAEARQKIGWYQDVFGAENFYLELQPHEIDILHDLNQWLIDYRQSGHTDVQLMATNDLHYVMESDADSHDTLLCVQTSALKSEENRMKLSPMASYYMKSAQEMRQSFGDAPSGMIDEALQNTLRVADMCDLDLDTDLYHLPVFPVPPGFDEKSYLRHLCEMGLSWRYGGQEDDPVLQERLETELGIIDSMGFNTYFLIVWDLCEFARHADIWWNVRGSGAGSLVAYCLGITSIDPIQNSLLFERFLNPGRVSMPDVDLDYPDDRRGEMIAYAAEKYGEDKVAAIITFGTMGAKAAIKDVGRALGVDLPVVNRVAGLIPQEARQKKIRDYIDASPELKQLYEKDSESRLMLDEAIRLQGMTRHTSIHAAGVIISDKPLVNYLPLHRVTGKDPSGGSLRAVTQFPMETAESIGLLKVDFLGLSTLTILRKACELIARHHDIHYTMENIPYRHDDSRRELTPEEHEKLDQAFEMMGRGETIGVFQVESPGMQAMLRGMRPGSFENIIAAISLYRPGPMDFIPTYNARLHDEEETTYLHEKLESILAETYGIIIYQEQIMQIAGELFGYDLGEADLMRRAVSKKKQEALMEHKTIFMERGPQNGIPAEVAEKIFDEIEFFANYGFNKSHASDYAVITVQTAYLKCHYPEEFMTALLQVHFDDSAKVATFLEECRRLAIPVLPPDVNASQLDFDIETLADGTRGIRFGLAAIKNAGVGALQHVIEMREAAGPFENLVDFCHRVDLRKVGKRALESLIKVNALCAFDERRDALLEALDRIVGFSAAYHKAQEVGQMSLFGGDTGFNEQLHIPPAQESVKTREQLLWEKELLGLYVTGRPVDRHRKKLAHLHTHEIRRVKDASNMNERAVRVAGEIVSLRKLTTRNGKLMAVLQLEDWHESAAVIEVVLFPDTFDQVMSDFNDWDRELVEGEIVLVLGNYDTSRDDPQIIARSVTTRFDVLVADTSSDYDHDYYDATYDEGMDYDETGEIMGYRDDGPPPPVQEMSPAVTLNESMPPVNGQRVSHSQNGYHSPPDSGNGSGYNGNGHGSSQAVDSPLVIDGEEIPPPPDFDDSGMVSSKPRHIRVIIRDTPNPDSDRRWIRSLYYTFLEYPGQDRFTIVFPRRGSSGKDLVVNFPGTTTGYCEDLYQKLCSQVDAANIQILDLDS